jgi:hypothetical protein
MFAGSWMAFSAPYYWREDYGYLGDWQPATVSLRLNKVMATAVLGSELVARLQNCSGSPEDFDRTIAAVQGYRNIVQEMEAVLRAVKPAREPKRELLEYPAICLKVAVNRDEA